MMHGRNKQVLLHLALTPNMGPATLLAIMRGLYYKQHPDVLDITWSDIMQAYAQLPLEQIYDYTVQDFVQVGIKAVQADLLVQGLRDRNVLDEELALIAKHQITLLTPFEDAYPELLKQIHHPPVVLYAAGKLDQQFDKCIAMVGSRKATAYAERVIGELVPSLVERGWTIASGGADGADTMAHRATLQARGSTIAVLGSGLLKPYPAGNSLLFDQIAAQGGLVMSPFPLRMPPDRGHFPMRNRIIAGLSLGCVVLQAAQRSGALITANFALEQGRQIFAVPGLVHDELSAGCHYLIRQGAALVTTVNDILEEFGESSTVAAVEQLSFIPAQKAVSMHGGNAQAVAAKQVQPKITPALFDNAQGPMSFDDLLAASGMQADVLQDYLFTLQLEGKVRQNFAGIWQLI